MRAISGDFHFYADPITKSRHWIFEPRKLSDVINYFNIDAETTSLLIQAHSALGRLEGISRYVPHMDYLEDMIIRHETCVLLSCKNGIRKIDVTMEVDSDSIYLPEEKGNY